MSIVRYGKLLGIGVVVFELGSCAVTYLVYRNVRDSQSSRKYLADRWPYLLEGYYKFYDVAGGFKSKAGTLQRAADTYDWCTEGYDGARDD